ncbi:MULTISPECIES: hypothetical protein [Natronorubrum]|uniref:Uncharacterized protein n=2 Tax=Natronorubrum bangense TaxID=61858 RepID=L9WTL0_9EURY|nr:hypothetical protein [Natronorubrum bangense]ELY52809.1 hypothetical protein C494_00065 [Natronorubrum bangense JCM 10635]QCC55051.1 hypothetical protein DV706_11575 [Natronorubrum bangense]
MVSRENRVLIGSLLAVWLAVVGIGLTGIGAQSAVVTFVVLAGIGIVVPQLYLAVTDDDVPGRQRVRIAAVLSLVIAMLGFSSADPGERLLIAGLVAALLIVLVAYEFTAGYRSTAAES